MIAAQGVVVLMSDKERMQSGFYAPEHHWPSLKILGRQMS